MTNSQKIQLRQSEVRERLNELSGLEGESFTPEHRAEVDTLSAEFKDLEARFRAAIVAETEAVPPVDREGSEGREVRELVRRSSLSAYLSEAVNQNPLSGSSPEAELRKTLLGEDAQPGFIPWAVLAPEVLEQRQTDADTVIAATVDIPNRQNQILGRVFAQSALSFLSVSPTSVPVGTAAWPVLTQGAEASMENPGDRTDAVAATFTATAIGPTRLSARYLFRVEDLARLEGMEDALRADLRFAIADQFDAQVIHGNSQAPQVSGILANTTGTTPPTDVFTWVDAVRAVASQVDGFYASTPAQVRMLVPPGLYEHLAVSLHATASVTAASRYIQEISGGLRVSAHMPSIPTSGASQNVGRALFAKTGARGSVMPVWEGLQLIRDPYSAAASGKVALTAIALWNFQVVRTAAYAQRQFRVA